MNDIISPYGENQSFNNKKKYSDKIRKIIFKGNNHSQILLSDKKINIKNLNLNLSNFNKKSEVNNEIIHSHRNYSKISFPFIKEKKDKKFDFFNSEKKELLSHNENFFSEINNEKKIKTGLNINSFLKREKGDSKILNIQSKKNTKNKNMNKINQIVNFLINSPLSNNTKNIYSKPIEKNRFPREKMIDPLYYIKYNINMTPKNENSSNGLRDYLKEIEKNIDLDDNKPYFLSNIKDINYGKIHVEHSNFSQSKIEANYKELLTKTKTYKNFKFSRNEDNSYIIKKNKIKKNVKENERKKKKSIIRDKFIKLLDYQNKKKGIIFRGNNMDKTFMKYISFDERMDNILNSSRQTQYSINKKSKYHESLINKINNIYKSY